MKYSKTAIGLLTAQYRSVLKKCLLINLGLFALGAVATATPANATDVATWSELKSGLATENADLSLTADITGNNFVSSSKGATIHLDTHNLTINDVDGESAAFQIKDSGMSVNGTGNLNFTNNDSTSGALRIWSRNSKNSVITADVNSIVFNNNTGSSMAGAIFHENEGYNASDSSTFSTLKANTISFINNEAKANNGAAILNTTGQLSVLGSTNTFTDNKRTKVESDVEKQYKRGGGAIANQSGTTADSLIVVGNENSTNSFTGNSSATNGGAILNRSVDTDKNAYLTVNGTSTYSNNTATLNGGAIYNIARDDETTGHIAEIILSGSSTFTGNKADGLGGAIWNSGKTSIIGSALFTGNTDSTGANDIYNTGILNLNATEATDSIILNGGIDGDANSKGTTNVSGAGSVKVANALKNQNVNNTGTLQLDGADLTGTTIAGDGKMEVVGDSALEDTTLTDQTFEVEANKELNLDNVTLNETANDKGGLNNLAGATLRINDSHINVNVNNAGTLYSDPTYYGKKVVNSGTATFDGDIFESTSELNNTATVNLLGDTEFVSGATITGNGVTNLVSGTTKFATTGTANANTINLASGANWTGTIANSNIVNLQNSVIDAISGSVSGGNVKLDANLVAGTVDTLGGTNSAHVDSLNILNDKYGTETSKTLTLGSGLTVDDNTVITGNSYYTKVEQSGNTLTFSDKLVNTSGMNTAIQNRIQLKEGETYGDTTKAYSTAAADDKFATQSALNTGLAAKQNKLTQAANGGTNITIDADGKISATDTNTTYTAGNGLNLTGTEFSVKPTESNSGLSVTGAGVAVSGITDANVTSISAGKVTGLANIATSGNYSDLTVADGAIAQSKVSGLTSSLAAKQATIDSDNMLDADLVDDSSATNKFVTAADKTAWNGKATLADVGAAGYAKIAKTPTLHQFTISNELTGDDAVSATFYDKDAVDSTFVKVSSQSGVKALDVTNSAATFTVTGDGNTNGYYNQFKVDADGNGIKLNAQSTNSADAGSSTLYVKGNGIYYNKGGSTATLPANEVVTIGTAKDGIYTPATDTDPAVTIAEAIASKQDALTAGSGISISEGTISAAGITTANIAANAAIAKTQLASGVQASLGKADTALQAHQTVALASGTDNGTVKLTVGDTVTDNIAVKGLGGAAYKAENYYATAAQHSALSETVAGHTTSISDLNTLTSSHTTSIANNTSAIQTLNGAASTAGSVRQLIQDNAKDATYSGSGADRVTIAEAINSKQATLAAGDNIQLSAPNPDTGLVTISATDTTYTADESTLTLSGTQFSVKDGGLTYAKMATGVKASLDKADSSIQGVKVNGTAVTPDTGKIVDISAITGVIVGDTAVTPDAGVVTLGAVAGASFADPLTITAPTDDDIEEWATINAANVANVGTTFDVLSKKLVNVENDLLYGATTNTHSIASALANTTATTNPLRTQVISMIHDNAAAGTYANTTSGLTADTIQEAIDENAGNIATNTAEIAKRKVTLGTGASAGYANISDGTNDVNVVSAEKATAIYNRAETWLKGVTGLDTQYSADTALQNALNAMSSDTDPNNISATSFAGALHELDGEKYSWSNIQGAAATETAGAETVTADTNVYSVDATEQAIQNALSDPTQDIVADDIHANTIEVAQSLSTPSLGLGTSTPVTGTSGVSAAGVVVVPTNEMPQLDAVGDDKTLQQPLHSTRRLTMF